MLFSFNRVWIEALAKKKTENTKEKKKRTTRAAAKDNPKQPQRVKSGPQGRVHEIFGILTLAAALLIGPSLFSVQFSDGTLMGPFGQTVGGVLNWALGLSAYICVGVLLIVAFRIFSSAIGKSFTPLPSITLWRKRLGILLLLGFGSMFLHLIGRPSRIADASYGGVIGETLSEMLCALVSDPGTWILTLTGLALAIVFATDFSWVRAFLNVWQATEQQVDGASGRFSRIKERMSLMGDWLSHQLRQVEERRQLAADANGAAALPPVVRLDLADHLVHEEEDENAAKKRLSLKSSAKKKKTLADHLADDEEILAPVNEEAVEANEEVEQELIVHQPLQTIEVDDQDIESVEELIEEEAAIGAALIAEALNEKDENEKESVQESKDFKAKKIAVDVEATAPPKSKKSGNKDEESTLTIVQPTFEAQKEADEDPEEKEVEDAKGQGFVLNDGVYRTPPLSLLKIHRSEGTLIDKEEIQRQATRLTQSLADYKIFGKVTEVHPGPVVTMYEFVPAPGTRISKIVSLSNDLAMSLHALRVRIVAPIPGRGAIGIEVPNVQRETVSFKEIVASDAFRKNKKGKLLLALGKSISGAPAVMDLAKMPHLLVAGATGAGKSVSINSMICSLLMRYSPEEVRMIMIDPKILELSGYNGIPHLLLPVVTDPKPAAIALRWTVNEMERRYQLLADQGVRDISTYNRKIDKMRAKVEADRQQELPLADQSSLLEETPDAIIRTQGESVEVENLEVEKTENEDIKNEEEERPDVIVPAEEPQKPIKVTDKNGNELMRMPFLVVIIDEFADLMTVASKEVETSVARLAQKARACGIHLVLATQRPSVDVITGLIKANFPSRMAFQVASNHDSKTILGSYGAENLLGAGDMLVLDRGAEMKRLHGAFIDDEEIEDIIEWLKGQGRPIYDMDILKAPEEEKEGGEGNSDEPVDSLYDEAIAFVAESKTASISAVQRRFRIGYNRSARMIEQMERDGIVGPPDGVRGRQVLVQNHTP